MNVSASTHPVYTLSEWRSLDLKGVTLTEPDQRLASQLAAGGMNSRLSLSEMREGLHISAKSWVGVVRFHQFEIQIVPKLVGGNLGLIDLIDFASNIDGLARYPAVRTLEGSGTGLFDLIALLFVEACERLARGGFLSDYIEVEDDLPTLRGRLLSDRQLLRRFGRVDRIECRFDDYRADIDENRILLAALSLCAGRVSHSAVSVRVRRMLAILSEVCDLEGLNLRTARTSLVYGRMNEQYREPHELAWLILDALGIDDLFASGSPRCFAFLLDMNRLFESFVTRWLRQILDDEPFQVTPQRRDRTILWHADEARPYAAVIPDVVIERHGAPGCLLPIDAKYKLYDQRSIAASDIYQTFLYAYAFGERHKLRPTALVLHPASSIDSQPTRLNVRRAGGTTSGQLQLFPIHIPTALSEAKSKVLSSIEMRLKNLISEALGSDVSIG